MIVVGLLGDRLVARFGRRRVLGLGGAGATVGAALLYPLTLSFAIGVAGEHGDAASARFMLAIGLAIAFTPVLLGTLADEVSLHRAHLMVPGLVALALVCFAVARGLEQRPAAVPATRC